MANGSDDSELVIDLVEGVIFCNLPSPSLNQHPEDVQDIIRTAWKADRDRFSACLQQINCSQVVCPNTFGLKEIRSATRRRKAFKPKPNKTRSLFILISTMGKMVGDAMLVQMSDGSWADLHELVLMVVGSVADYLPILIVCAIEDPLEAVKSKSHVERGRIETEQTESGVLVLWSLLPMHPLWIEEDGTVLVPVLSDVVAGSGDSSTVQEMFSRIEGVLEWYNSSRQRLVKEVSTWSSMAGTGEDGDDDDDDDDDAVASQGADDEGSARAALPPDAAGAAQDREGKTPSVAARGSGVGEGEVTGEASSDLGGGTPRYNIGSMWACYGVWRGVDQGCRLQLGRVAMPSFSPSGNTLLDNDGALIWHKQWQSFSVHTHQVKVTMVSQTEGATVYYTTDGSDPEPEVGSTHRFRKPVLLDYYGDGFRDYVIKAVAVKEGLPSSRVSESDVYRIQGQVKRVTFQDVRIDDSVLLSMSCATPGATIFFNDAGGIPTLSSPVYASPIRLHSKIVQAFATAPGQTNSIVSTFELLDQVALPQVEMEGEIALTSSLEAADGAVGEGRERLVVVGDHDGAEGAPRGGGVRYEVFLDEATVKVSSKSSEAAGFRMFYTRDRSKPTPGSRRYTGPIHIKQAGTHYFTFMAIAHLMADSELVEMSLTVQNRVATPSIQPDGATYKIETTTSCECATEGASLFLSVDGSDPLPGSPATIAYSGPIHFDRRNPDLFAPGAILSAFSTDPFVPLDIHVRLYAMKRQHVDSFPAEAHFRLLEVVQTPTARPDSGLFSELVDVELVSGTAGAAILYTMDGSYPTTDSAVYSGPIRVTKVGWTTITARAVKEDMWDSETFTVKYGVEAQVLAWGHARDGRLGTNSEEDTHKPARVNGLLEYSIERVACGRAHTILLDSQGNVLTCGLKLHGRLGHEEAARMEPMQIRFEKGGPIKISQIAAGERHTMLLAKNGAVFTFGDGKSGQLGHGDWDACSTARVVERVTTGRRADGKQTGTTSAVKAIAAGAFHSLVLSRDGLVWSWGRGGEGQLGNEERFSTSVPDRMAAKLVDGEEEGLYGKKVAAIAGGDWHSVMLLADGTVFTCGRGIEGQLGYEDVTFMLMPGKIHSLDNAHQPIVQVAAGRAHTLLLDREGRVWSCGCGDRGQCGLGKESWVLPQVVFEHKDLCQIAAGPEYSVARANSGAVWVWGRGDWGQLCLGDSEDRGEPTRVDALEGFKVKDIGVGERHMVAVISKDHLLVPASRGHLASGSSADVATRPRRTSIVDDASIGRVDSSAVDSEGGGTWRAGRRTGRRRSSVLSVGSEATSSLHVSRTPSGLAEGLASNVLGSGR